METKSPSFGMGARFSRSMNYFKIANNKKYDAMQNGVDELSEDVATFVTRRKGMALAGNSVTVIVSELPKKGWEGVKQFFRKSPKPAKNSTFAYFDRFDEQIINLTNATKEQYKKINGI
ncbi:MAG: hypothetical protein A2Y25_02815 [Candidatus Melainabacteria bacterium GWF2_37_15]|nr:MAG: hypothetical protein A2Y25_02815 [Candidatus Melainabacteria bacterium GWF2_37_15]